MINLSQIYAEYLSSLKEEKERDPYRLFVSDVGKCPRQVGYRLIGTAKNPEAEQTGWNRSIMFDNALHMEQRMIEALEWKGLLIAEQMDVDVYDRDNWGGRFDMIANLDGIRVVEYKTANSNAFRHDFDRDDYRLQASTYHVYCEDEYGLTAPPLIPLFDRGGTNTYKWEEVEVEPERVAMLMDELEWVRKDAKNDMVLTPQLDKVLVKRSYEKALVLEAPWDCGWCDYSDECQPDMSTSTWAKRTDNREPWTVCKAADPTILEEWATRETEELV
jgi:CRISPR/Cas system-associated exonuclease Cas4 (RecB family)